MRPREPLGPQTEPQADREEHDDEGDQRGASDETDVDRMNRNGHTYETPGRRGFFPYTL